MKVIEQLCIKSFEVSDEALNSWKAIQGTIYTTSVPEEHINTVQVFSNYWVRVQKEHFVRVE